MTQLIGFGLIWWVAGIYLLLIVIAHGAWWRKRAYFPNLDLCSDAHDRFHISNRDKKDLDAEKLEEARQRFWHRIGLKLISDVPAELSIAGFFCALVWPVFVLLNVLLLAQVVGTQVGAGGGSWEIWPFGTYGAIPLATAILYAVGQTAFGIFFGEAESKDKKRYLALLFLVLAILLEGGLAVYRAWLIRGGGAAAGANLVDNSLATQFGDVVGAFFGIFFPAAHAALGYVAFPNFVRPVIRYAIRFCGGLSTLAWAAANYVLLAWHPVHPKDFPEFLEANPQFNPIRHEIITPEEKAQWDRQRRLLANAEALYGDLKLLLNDLPATPTTLERSRDALEGARKLLRHWQDIAMSANGELEDASVLLPYASTPAAASDSGAARLAPLHRLADSHDRLVKFIRHIRDVEDELDREAQTEGKRVRMLVESCRADLGRLQHRLEEIRNIAHFGSDADGLIKHCETLLKILVDTFRQIPQPGPGQYRFPDYEVLNDKVAQCQAGYTLLTERWAKEEPAIPLASELKSRQEELDAAANVTNLTKAYTDTSKALYEIKLTASERLKRVEGRPRWFYWLADKVA